MNQRTKLYILHYSILSVYSYLCCVELSTCPFIVWNSNDPKGKKIIYAFIMNDKIILYCIVSDTLLCLCI